MSGRRTADRLPADRLGRATCVLPACLRAGCGVLASAVHMGALRARGCSGPGAMQCNNNNNSNVCRGMQGSTGGCGQVVGDAKAVSQSARRRHAP